MKNISRKFKSIIIIICLLQLIACPNSANSIKEYRDIQLIDYNLKQPVSIVQIKVTIYVDDEIVNSADFFVEKNEMIGKKIKRLKKNIKGESLFDVNNKPVTEEFDFTTKCQLTDIFRDTQGRLCIKYIDAEGQEFIKMAKKEQSSTN